VNKYPNRGPRRDPGKNSYSSTQGMAIITHSGVEEYLLLTPDKKIISAPEQLLYLLAF
jgi:hypothetical protein